MYYYRVKDYYYNVMSDSTPWATYNEALTAAKEYLISTNIHDSYYIEIYNEPPYEGLTPIQTIFITQGEVSAYALKRIEEANKEEFAEYIARAASNYDLHKDQYDRGLLTPLEFARLQEQVWIIARLAIEAKM